MKFVGGLPCLDFTNTVGEWSAGRVLEDKLENYSDLIGWARLAGLLDASDGIALARLARSSPQQAKKIILRARALRGALHRLFNSSTGRRNPAAADIRLLEDELRISQRHQRFAANGHRFSWTWNNRPALDSILWRVSQSAADLLTSPDLTLVRRCAGENCGWMFLDTTRNHSRHWCDMKDCGNLAKVRRFRARHAEV